MVLLPAASNETLCDWIIISVAELLSSGTAAVWGDINYRGGKVVTTIHYGIKEHKEEVVTFYLAHLKSN